MMETLIAPELAWIAEGLLLSLALGLVASAIVGLFMLVRPERLFSVNERWSRWIDTTGQFEALDRPYSLERIFYRHHRLTGALITLGSSFVLWQWMFAYRRSGVFSMLAARWSQPELSWAVSAGEWIVVGLHLLILVVGLVILLRPSLLKAIESGGNRWHQPKVAQGLDHVYSPLERGFQLHPRVSGLSLLLASTWCLSGLLPVLSRLL